MTSLTITRGLPAAGKTTWAKAWVSESPTTRARVNRDDLRSMLYGQRSGLTFEQEQRITAAAQSLVRELLARGLDVVADDTNLRPKYVREWRKVATTSGAEFDVREYLISPTVAIERDANREHSVGAEVIQRMAEKFTRKGELLPVPDEDQPTSLRPYVAPEDKPAAVLVDIDGTLARMAGRGPYDLDRVHEDEPVEHIVDLVGQLRRAHHVIFMSGREDSCREQTEAWLAQHVGRGEWEPLHMRPAGDRRRDSIVKAELFDRHVRDEYNVRLVLDDRDQVVKMWRSLGLTCLQVAEGNF